MILSEVTETLAGIPCETADGNAIGFGVDIENLSPEAINDLCPPATMILAWTRITSVQMKLMYYLKVNVLTVRSTRVINGWGKFS